MKEQGTVINVALAYVLWRSIGQTLLFKDDASNSNTEYQIKADNIYQLVDSIREKTSHLTKISDRQKIVDEIAEQLGVPLYCDDKLLFRMLNAQELIKLANQNVNIQLHTHHHLSSPEEQKFNDEISENIDFIRTITPKAKIEHFCYHSGEFYNQQIPWLKRFCVKSATIASPGMLTRRTNLMKIPRFFDGEDVHQLEFEAELCGFASFYRRLVS